MVVAEVVKDSGPMELMFNIQVTPQLKVCHVPKSKIIDSVKRGYYFGLSNMDDLSDEVIDLRKIDIFSKLYLMESQNKLEKWVEKYHSYMKQLKRSESERQQLLTEYNEAVMGCDLQSIDRALYKEADKHATKLLTLHV